MSIEPQTLMLSALQHYAYCPRQFALIHVEQAWADNRFTAEGTILHERVDSGIAEQRKGTRYERGVMLKSERFKLTGKMDLLEIEQSEQPKYLPVEYKRGKPKIEDWDRVQVCAQALCLEEMRDTSVTEGAIWYWEVRRRETIQIDDALRAATIAAIEAAHAILATGKTPPPTDDVKRCRACSLVDLCEPGIFRRDHSSDYVDAIFLEPEEAMGK
ncbi:MAG: CRISPR-associated protein Cas4 [Gammaproteobacteria bacterium]|nr:CRISPR-associated protein Cas4 [Gammaproteobacteria bacterium]